MSEILFIRHAETDMSGTFCGHSDPELNAKGLSQIADLLREIRTAEIAAVYTSDLRRARATANPIAEAFGVECHASTELREINFGQWEGLTWDEIEQIDEAYARKWVLEYPYFPARNGENYRNFRRRVLNQVNFLSKEAESRRCSIAVVTHAGVLRAILTILQGYSEEDAIEATKSYCSIVHHNATTSFGSRNYATANEDR